MEVNHGTLRLYLDGTKEIPHNHDYNDDKQHSHPSYPKHAVIATIMYKKLDALSLRGEETYLCESPLSSNQFYRGLATLEGMYNDSGNQNGGKLKGRRNGYKGIGKVLVV